jgi:HK97 family phage major capsid protein
MKNYNIIRRWLLPAIAVLIVALVMNGNIDPASGAGLAVLPILGFRRGFLMDKFDADMGSGGSALEEKDFQAKVLGNQKVMKVEQEELLKNVGNLDKETKKALQEVTDAKNKFDGLDSDFKALDVAMKKLQVMLTLEQRMANGGNTLSLGQRTIKDKETAKQVFAMIARSICKEDAAKRALGEDTSPGSTYITDELSTDIYDSLLRYGAWGTLGVRPVGTKNHKIPIKTTRPVANFILAEGGTINDDTTKAGTTASLEVEIMAVLLNVSLQLIEDGEIDVVADVIDDFIEALNFRLDYAAFSGNGTADGPNGGITGLFNFGTASTATAGRLSIASTKYDDWLKCLTTVDAVVLSRPARWWMHPTNIAAAVGVKDDNGRPIFQTALESPAGGILNIFGFPVTPVGAAPSANAASAKVAAFGDPRAFAVAVRKQFAIEESDHARWTTLERSFRGHGRADAVGLKASALAVMTLPAT